MPDIKPGDRVLHEQEAFGIVKEVTDTDLVVDFEIRGELRVPRNSVEEAFPFDGVIFEVEALSIEECRQALQLVRNLRVTSEKPTKTRKTGGQAMTESLSEISKNPEVMKALRASGKLAAFGLD